MLCRHFGDVEEMEWVLEAATKNNTLHDVNDKTIILAVSPFQCKLGLPVGLARRKERLHIKKKLQTQKQELKDVIKIFHPSYLQ